MPSQFSGINKIADRINPNIIASKIKIIFSTLEGRRRFRDIAWLSDSEENN
jgi:hypothetical protein